MQRHRRLFILWLFFAIFFLSSCNFQSRSGPVPAGSGPVFTQAAYTVVAHLTQIATTGTAVSSTDIAPTANASEPPASTLPAAKPTLPSATPAASSTALPTHTPHPETPTPTAPAASPPPCNLDQCVNIVYNFASSYCSAIWQSGAGLLACPGKRDEPAGFVIQLDNPVLESRHENESTLWTNPQLSQDGWIHGVYPAFTVKSGDHFLADIGCLSESGNCDVIFQLNYKIGSGPVKNLGEWREVYDGETTRADVELSSLADQSVEFILAVLANGEPQEDAAFWLMPQIRRP